MIGRPGADPRMSGGVRSAVAVVALPAVAACGDGAEQAKQARLLSAARAGMQAVRGLPGGRTATFTAVRLIGETTVCGMIDGNDGVGPRAFSAKGADLAVADPRDPATKAAIDRTCAGSPVHEIVSRNPQFSDIDVAD